MRVDTTGMIVKRDDGFHAQIDIWCESRKNRYLLRVNISPFAYMDRATRFVNGEVYHLGGSRYIDHVFIELNLLLQENEKDLREHAQIMQNWARAGHTVPERTFFLSRAQECIRNANIR